MDGSFENYLQESGLKKHIKNSDSFNLKLYHDLNIYGDIAEGYVELLRDKYDVNIDKFVFKDYFPSEYVGKPFLASCLYTILPFLRKKYDSKNEFKPITFRKIEQAIKEKVLI